MKKLFSLILVLGLLFGGTAYTKEVILHCKNHKVVGHYKYGGGTSTDPGNTELDKTFKINSANKTISYLSFDGSFFEIKNVKWSEGYISWKVGNITEEEINRIDLSYKSNLYLKGEDLFKKIETFGRCSIAKKVI